MGGHEKYCGTKPRDQFLEALILCNTVLEATWTLVFGFWLSAF
jgi:hypothetical protein